MKRKWIIPILVIVSLLLALAGTPVSAEDNGNFKKFPSVGSRPSFVQDEIIVKFKTGVSEETIAEIGQRHGTSVLHTSPRGKFKILRIPKGKSAPEMVELYARNPNVEYAELNTLAQAFWQPDDPYYSYQWHLDNPEYGGINCEDAWEVNHSTPGLGVIVAVLDTGVAYENYSERVGWRYLRYGQAPDLAQTSFVAGWDFANNDAHPNDDHGHGTHVTGTIAQSTNNSLGTAGVAFEATIMPVKVLNSSGSGSAQWIADGIYYATDNGAQVINMSLGWPVEDGIASDPGITVREAVQYAYNNGVTIIAAAGNDYESVVAYPAAYDEYVIAVGATRYNESLAPYSNTGISLDLTAPGGDNSVDMNGDGEPDGVLQQTFSSGWWGQTFNYYWMSGTSCATPHVAGVAALVIANGTTGPDNVRAALEQNAEDHGPAGRDNQYGWGIVDAYAALNGGATPNNAPVADDQPVATDEDTAKSITLTASDPDGDPLTYSIVSQPLNGTLTGTAPDVTYTPDANYNGSDSFTFKANDGKVDSNTATVSITVSPVNDAPDQPTLIAPDNGGVDISTDPTLEVVVSDPDADPLDVTFYGREVGTGTGEDFTVIALPDTQNESQYYPAVFMSQTQWMVDNEAARNIVFVTHVGDIVNTATSTTEWNNADAAMDLLDPAGIPYSVGPGNHDIGTGSLYETYFGILRFSGKSWYGGYYSGDNCNNYSLFSVEGMNFILINLQYNSTTAMLDWADALLKANPTRRGIVVQHNILNTDNSWQNQAPYTALKDNPNLFLMLCGHMHSSSDGAAYRAELGGDGHTIHIMLADYQDYPNGGNGYLRILRFSPADDKIYATTYSPYTGTSITSSPDQMEMDYDMAGGAAFEVIGTVNGVASGNNASITWLGLALGTTYEWYVEVSDGFQTTTGSTWSFVTGGSANIPPTVNAGPDQTADEGDTVNFSGSASDSDGAIVSYEWNFDDGGVASDTWTPSHAYADNGVYTVTLTVTDDDGATGTDTVAVTVNNVAPIADAGGRYRGIVGGSIVLSGNATDPGTADVLTYSWDFGDGSPAETGQTVSHTYSATGTYTATLTVTDDDGGVDTDTAQVSVNETTSRPGRGQRG